MSDDYFTTELSTDFALTPAQEVRLGVLRILGEDGIPTDAIDDPAAFAAAVASIADPLVEWVLTGNAPSARLATADEAAAQPA